MSKFLANLKVSSFLAYKSIRRGDIGAIIFTVLIITLAFINITLVYSLLDGVIERAEMNVIDLQYGHVVIDPIEEELFIDDADSLVKRVVALPEVTGIASHYIIGASIFHDDESVEYKIYSIDPVDEVTVTSLQDYIVEGNFLGKHDTDSILLGNEISGGYDAKFELASLGGVRAGDTVTVRFNNGVIKDYRVKGIFNTMDVVTDMRAYISEKEMEDVLGVSGKASEIVIRLDKIGKEKEFMESLLALGIKEKVIWWKDRAGIALSMTRSFVILKSMFGFISLFVAAVTIFIVIYINTVNKRREIGVLKAIGVKENVIIKSFLFQAMFYTLAGCLLGYLAMMLFINPYFEIRPLKFPIGWVTLNIIPATTFKGLFILIVAAIFSGVVPSWNTTRKKIMKLIWG
jgi:putative ABC transport system permease protein